MNNLISEQQRKSWNNFSSGWKKWDSFVTGWLYPIGSEMLDAVNIQSDHLVLDIATGTGEPGLTGAVKVPDGKVIGIDIAEDMVKIANESAAQRGVANYEAKACDATSISFSNDSFDSVICRHGVMFFPDPVQCLKEMARVLKPGGKLAISAWASPGDNNWATLISGIINNTLCLPPPPKEAPGLFRFGEEGQLSALLRETGLAELNEKTLFGNVVFEYPQQYWDFMTEVAAPVASALSDIDEKTLAFIKSQVISVVQRLDRVGVLDWCARVASGTKK